ncbi:MAG: phosphotransferase [Gemmatimonadota bacterium]
MPGFETGRASLLGQLDEELGGGPRSWTDLIVVRNVGPVLSARPLSGDGVSTRGFNAILLSPRGTPSHYLKVRSAGNEAFLREATVHTALGRHPDARSMVTRARTFLHGPMRILASEFLHGDRMDVVLAKGKGKGVWSETVGKVIAASQPFWGALGQVLEKSGEIPAGSATLGEATREFATLRESGLSDGTVRTLSDRLREVWLPPVPQHGDFWPRNLFRVGEGWRILDFETCGSVDLPLFDIFHLIRGSVYAAGGGGAGTWLESWAAVGREADALRESVKPHADGLDQDQIEAALVGYLTLFSARLIRRGNPRNRTAPWIWELERLPEILGKPLVSQAVRGLSAQGPL